MRARFKVLGADLTRQGAAARALRCPQMASAGKDSKFSTTCKPSPLRGRAWWRRHADPPKESNTNTARDPCWVVNPRGRAIPASLLHSSGEGDRAFGTERYQDCRNRHGRQ